MKRMALLGCGGFFRRYHMSTLLADPQTQVVGISIRNRPHLCMN